jgi:hypothetical protein
MTEAKVVKAEEKAKKVTESIKKLEEGRPTDYSQSLQDLICSRLSQGESMKSISRDEDMPAACTLFRWLREHEEFKDQYDIAKEESAESLADEMVDIADYEAGQPLMQDGSPVMVDGKIVMVIDAPGVSHAKLRIDTRKWAASKLKPKKYGEKIQNEIIPGKGVVFNMSFGAKPTDDND